MHKISLRSWIFSILWIAYCGGCILWSNVFAKTHITLSWFPTPIFIGELLLLAGIFFSWPEIMCSSAKIKRIIFASFIFLFVATIIGFIQYGSLTFRHATTLAYIFFAFLIYWHTSKKQILVIIGFGLYMIFLPIRFGFSGNEFYVFSVWALACFALSLLLKWMNIGKTKYSICMVIFGFLAVPLYLLFHTARTFIVANCVSSLCLLSGIIIINKASAVKKITFLVLCVSILFGSIYFIADRNALRSMVNIKEIISAIKIYNQEYLRSKKDFKFKKVPVSIYRPVGQSDGEIHALAKQSEKSPIDELDTITVNNQVYNRVTNMLKVMMSDPDIVIIKNQAYAPISDMKKSQIDEPSAIAIKGKTYIPIRDMKNLPIADPNTIIVKNQIYVPVNDTIKPLDVKPELRNYKNAKQNILFRIFVWKGLFEELIEERAILGFGLGKPFCPMTTQVLGWTDRLYLIDGWVSTHNSWFHLIYLFGVLGFFIVLAVWFMWGHMFFRAVSNKDFWGIFLCSALINFMVGALSQPLLEQPHYAIFFWGLWGIVFRRVYITKGLVK